MSDRDEARRQARALWSRYPAGTGYVLSPRGTPEFYEEMRTTRYRLQPWHPDLLRRYTGDLLLEIGCGAGTDLAMLGSGFRHAIGVDLAEPGAALARGSLAHWGVAGATAVADAQHLPFGDSAFDFVYSFGVIHHTDDPSAAVREIRRVLKPGGKALVGVYHRWSLFAIGRFAKYVLSGRFLRIRWAEDKSMLEGGAADNCLTPKVALFTRRTARDLMSGFRRTRVFAVHNGTRLRLPTQVDRPLMAVLGWYLIVEGTR